MKLEKSSWKKLWNSSGISYVILPQKCKEFELWKVVFKNFIEKRDVIEGAEEKLRK